MNAHAAKAQKYVDALSYADSQAFAQKTLYAMIDQRPYPSESPYKITRTMTPGAQFRRASAIRKKLQGILYP